MIFDTSKTVQELECKVAKLTLQKRHLINELALLRAKAKAYDEGETQSAIYNGKDEFMWSDNCINLREKADLPIGCTCRKVRVCKEVEKD
jgi:hypothetical protein